MNENESENVTSGEKEHVDWINVHIRKWRVKLLFEKFISKKRANSVTLLFIYIYYGRRIKCPVF